jgi:ankyrin repeat protein
VQKGANVNIANNQGSTALAKAVEREMPEIVQLLLDKGADYNTVNCFGSSPLNIAIESKQIDLAK